MTRTTIVSVVAAGALLAVPAAGQADHKGTAHGKGKAKSCAKAQKVGYSLGGTLVSVVADDPATPANEGTVTFTLTSANSHARKSGELADQDATKDGLQWKGGSYTVPTTDAYVLKLSGFEGTDTPSPGDKVKVVGSIALTKKRCAAAGTSTADRYGAVNVRKVTVSDRDADA